MYMIGLHEAPSVPSIDSGQRMVLREGVVLAIEPFLSVSADYVVTMRMDGHFGPLTGAWLLSSSTQSW